MAFTSADLDAINSAIASGAKRVRFQTHEVEYQSVAEMLRARDVIKAELEVPPSDGGAMFARFESDY